MASQDMLKKLLEEFDEKEAQAREEINIVNVRIEELEKRIGSSRTRLEKISMDRHKIGEMMERYVAGNFFKKGEGGFAASLSSSSAGVQTPSQFGAGANSASSPSFASLASKPATPESAPPSISSPMHSASASANASPALSVVASLSNSGAQTPVTPFAAPESEVSPFGGPAATSAPAPFSSSTQGASSATPSVFGTSPTPAAATPAPSPTSTPTPTPTPTPLSSLSTASLFSSLPTTGVTPTASPTATGENPALPPETPSPFATPAPSSTAALAASGGLSAALMQSMPFGGTPTPPQETSKASGKFDMMDLFAPLGNDEQASSPDAAAPVSEPAPHVAEQALAQNQFYQSAPTPPAADPSAQAAPSPSMAGANIFQDPGQTDSTATQDHPSLNLGDEAVQIQDLEEENDDTVKSINDALRGLFR